MTKLKIEYPEGVSVVVVTFNGGKRLIPTLQHILQLERNDLPVEIVIIDNNSDDNTVEIINETLINSPIPYRIIQEEKQGPAYARKRGLIDSKYAYVLFCDDDNWLSKDYLKIGTEILKSDNKIAAIGGMGVPVHENLSTVPSWFNDYINAVGCGPQGICSGDITNEKGCLYTAGAFIRKSCALELYNSGFHPALSGRVGKSLVAGEDTEMTYFLKIMGYKLFYNEDLVFNHYMPCNRTNIVYFKKLYRSFGFSNEMLRPVREYIRPENEKRKNYLSLLRDIFYLWRKQFFDESPAVIFEYNRLLGQIKGKLFGKKVKAKILSNLLLFKD